MPLKPPQSYELDASDTPLTSQHNFDDGASLSDVDDFDPLKSSHRPYTDDARQPLRSVFDTSRSTSRSWIAPTSKRRHPWLRWLVPSRFCCILISLFFATLILLLSAGGLWVYKNGVPEDGQSEPWYPSPKGGTVEAWAKSYERATRLVEQMTLVEKVNITTGVGWSMGLCVGNTGPVDRLGFPSLCLQDGPLGVRFADNITAFPAGITVGATWNKHLMYERGKAHGFEARMKGVNVLLGPAMGPLGRLPAGGRNWEGFGSDPVLQGIAAAATIRGIQDTGVIATAKHLIGNEQEHFRQSWEWGTPNAISSNIDDRTLHEIYAWPFAESVRAGVASVMCSYNMVNNSYACQNSKLMNGLLKDELGFQGFVQSDWLAQRAGVAASLAGLDMSMPGDGLKWSDGNSLWGGALTQAVLNASVPMERLNDMVLRIVAAWYQLGQDDEKRWPSAKDGGGPNFSSWTNDKVGRIHHGSPDSEETGVVNKFVPVRNTVEGGDHDELARTIATEGIVLVKNEGNLLPFARNGSRNTLVKPHDGKVQVGIFGEDAWPNAKGINSCLDRGCNEGTLTMGWGSGSVELPYLIAPAHALHDAFDAQHVQVNDWKTNEVGGVEEEASKQDMCLVFISSDAGEGYLRWGSVMGDRNDLYAQKNGDELVTKVANSCGGETIVILHTVGPTILEKWIDLPNVKAVLIAHLPGSEAGPALANVLFGEVNPSGHLPYTIAKNEDNYGPDSKILRLPNHVVPQQNFSEGIYVDYRYLDKHDIVPRYEFGYGLSYSSFKLSSVVVSPQGLVSSEPAPRPAPRVSPPRLDNTIPDPASAVKPAGFRKLQKYIYPYIDSVENVRRDAQSPAAPQTPHEPSQAGGAQGGNPDLYTTAVTVQATLTNLGPLPGAAVVQAYISFPKEVIDGDGNPVDMPVRVLRQFDKIKVGVANNEKRKAVKMELTRKDLSYWDVKKQNWMVPEGTFTLCLGFSSRDLDRCVTFEPLIKLNTGPSSA